MRGFIDENNDYVCYQHEILRCRHIRRRMMEEALANWRVEVTTRQTEADLRLKKKIRKQMKKQMKKTA